MTRYFEQLREATEHIFYKPGFRKICYDDAIAIAIKMQVKHPEWLLCGSLGIMLAGYMKIGQVSDIDFVTSSFPEGVKFIPHKYHKMETNTSYYHFEYDEYVDLFVHTKPLRSSGKYYYPNGLRVQRVKDMLWWKKHFNRDKDKNDLMQIHLPESLFEI
jgi:hypothetical protein